MRKPILCAALFGASVQIASLSSAEIQKIPPVEEQLMPADGEIALARAVESDNHVICRVLRGWGAPTFTPAEPLELQELRATLGIEGENRDQSAAGGDAYARSNPEWKEWLPRTCSQRTRTSRREQALASSHDG